MGAPNKRFCIRGHDTWEVGRFPSAGRCKVCSRMAGQGALKPLGPRLPYEPLGEALKLKGISISSFGGSGSRSIHRYQKRGLTWEAADEWACKIGMHPVQIWGTDFYTYDEETA
jgi:hypothetical protein